MDVKLATLIKSLNIMDVIFSGFTVIFKLFTFAYTKHSYQILNILEAH